MKCWSQRPKYIGWYRANPPLQGDVVDSGSVRATWYMVCWCALPGAIIRTYLNCRWYESTSVNLAPYDKPGSRSSSFIEMRFSRPWGIVISSKTIPWSASGVPIANILVSSQPIRSLSTLYPLISAWMLGSPSARLRMCSCFSRVIMAKVSGLFRKGIKVVKRPTLLLVSNPFVWYGQIKKIGYLEGGLTFWSMIRVSSLLLFTFMCTMWTLYSILRALTWGRKTRYKSSSVVKNILMTSLAGQLNFPRQQVWLGEVRGARNSEQGLWSPLVSPTMHAMVRLPGEMACWKISDRGKVNFSWRSRLASGACPLSKANR